MLLKELPLPISDESARSYALVFSADLAARLAQLHSLYGSENCTLSPSVLRDGRLMLSADVLTEVRPGGLLAEMWAHADQAFLGASVEVIAWGDAVAMSPEPEPMPWGM